MLRCSVPYPQRLAVAADRVCTFNFSKIAFRMPFHCIGSVTSFSAISYWLSLVPIIPKLPVRDLSTCLIRSAIDESFLSLLSAAEGGTVEGPLFNKCRNRELCVGALDLFRLCDAADNDGRNPSGLRCSQQLVAFQIGIRRILMGDATHNSL